MNNINILPSELYQTVFSFLPLNDAVRAQRTSRQWSEEVGKENRNIMMRCMKPFFHKWFQEKKESRFQDIDVGESSPDKILQALSQRKIGTMIVEVAPHTDKKLDLQLKYKSRDLPEGDATSFLERVMPSGPSLAEFRENDFRVQYRMYIDGSQVSKQWQFSALKIMAAGLRIIHITLTAVGTLPLFASAVALAIGCKTISFLSAKILPNIINRRVDDVVTRISNTIILVLDQVARIFVRAPLNYVQRKLLSPINSQALHLIRDRQNIWKIETLRVDCLNKPKRLATVEALSSSIQALT